MDKTCRNCGASKGLHHHKTSQCPVGGVEAGIGTAQKWQNSTFEIDNSAEVTALVDFIASLKSSLSDARNDAIEAGAWEAGEKETK